MLKGVKRSEIQRGQAGLLSSNRSKHHGKQEMRLSVVFSCARFFAPLALSRRRGLVSPT